MKRAAILLLLAALLLTGCGAEEAQPQTPYTQFVGNTQFYVDPVAMTITANGHVFAYKYTQDGCSVTYPNGAVVTQMGNGVSWGNADAEFIISNGSNYVDCNVLLMLVPEQVAQEEKGEWIPLIFVGIAIAAMGVWMYACPHVLWKWKYGWRYKNAEPSDTGLAVIMASGIIEIIVGIIMVLIGIFA
jgi:hypothetical protein